MRGRGGRPQRLRGFLVVFWGLYAVIGIPALVFGLAMGEGVPWQFVLL
jgi:hypothetical protein